MGRGCKSDYAKTSQSEVNIDPPNEPTESSQLETPFRELSDELAFDAEVLPHPGIIFFRSDEAALIRGQNPSGADRNGVLDESVEQDRRHFVNETLTPILRKTNDCELWPKRLGN